MKASHSNAALALLALLVPVAARAQAGDVVPSPGQVSNPSAKPEVAPGAVLDVDGEVARPGVLPRSTSDAARAAFERLVAASLAGATAERARVTAFDLSIDLRFRGATGQSNDLANARYQWLAPGYLRADTGRGRAHLRGPNPKGGFANFTIDASNQDKIAVIPIDLGRENAEDRRQIEEEASVAANFAALVDPRSMRVLRLATKPAAPEMLPPALRARAAQLAWLELESPDPWVPRAQGGPARRARLALGLDPATSRPAIAVVDDALAHGPVSRSTSILELDDYRPTDGFQVPFSIRVWIAETAEGTGPGAEPRLRDKPSMDMFLKAAALRARLEPQDFLPEASGADAARRPSGG